MEAARFIAGTAIAQKGRVAPIVIKNNILVI